MNDLFESVENLNDNKSKINNYMVNGIFNIEVCYIDEDDDLIHYNIYISNIISSTIIEYWRYKDEFKKFAN